MKRFIFMVFCLMLINYGVWAGQNKTGSGDTREVHIFNWLIGSERDLLVELEKEFMVKYPDIKVVDITSGAGTKDSKSAIRSAILAGEVFDVLISTWPAFEQELIDAGLMQDVRKYWDKYQWSKYLGDGWKNLGSFNGKPYSVYFLAGNRSALWYRPPVIKKAGIKGDPATLDEWIADLEALKETGVTPFTFGAKSWAHTEWFENLILKTAGVEFARKLVNREVPWTSPEVKETLQNWRRLLPYTHPAETLFSLAWNDAADQVFSKDSVTIAGYNLIGNWVNAMAQDKYGLTPEVDYSFAMFPAVKPEYADTMSIDGKSLLISTNAPNPDNGALFINFVLSAEGSKIIAKNSFATPSSSADMSDYDPVMMKYLKTVGKADVFFVLDDLLPTEMSSEFRTGLQEFLEDPSDSNISAVQDKLEKAAKRIYKK